MKTNDELCEECTLKPVHAGRDILWCDNVSFNSYQIPASIQLSFTQQPAKLGQKAPSLTNNDVKRLPLTDRQEILHTSCPEMTQVRGRDGNAEER